ncbi:MULTISPECIES: hypothetical protein [Alphaproteobacteria]|uniref:hypothetical protein n=1 Tax=Alphaproteobacteria TaxID=28211 RepID=UPI003517DBAD
MATVLEMLGAVAQIREAVSALKDEKTRREFGYPNDHFARIGEALSDIYFPDDGILVVLRKIVGGEEVDERDMARLVEFNQREEPVRSATENMVLDYGKGARNSIKQSAVIGQIRNRKITLRGAVQIAINEALTFNHKLNLEEVSALIAEIEALNQDIQEAEHELRQFQ